MANLSISDALLRKLETIAQQTGQTPEEIIADALADYSEQALPVDASSTPPLLLAQLRQRAGQELAHHGIVISEEIIKDRGD